MTLRGVVADAAEKIKADLLQGLQVPDRWAVPILLYLRPPQANAPEIPPVDLHFSQTGAGLKIQLDFLIPRDFDPAVLRRETVRALLLEMSYRALPSLPAGQPYTAPPYWLVEGIFAVTGQAGAEAAVPSSEHSLPLEGLITQRPGMLDSPSRALYRASAGELVRFLVSGGDGRARLCRFISDLPAATNNPLADLRQHFPQLGGTDAEMERNWNAFLSRDHPGFELTGFNGTSARLDELLRIRIGRARRAHQGLTLGELISLPRPEVERPAALDLGQRLALLGAVAHPLLRPIVLDYTQILEALLARKTRGLRRRFDNTVALRSRVTQRMKQVDDYMNWFEATQAESASGIFGGYLRAAETDVNAPRRRDPISVYLDALEVQFY